MNAPAFCVMMGRFAVSSDVQTVMESFVGSGIALCLYDPHVKVGCMAHVVHPEIGEEKKGGGNYAKYANIAIQNAINSMLEKGAHPERIVAKMAGGAEIFSHQEKQGLFNIGERNIQALKSLLSQNGIRLVSEDTGMNHSRHVKFNVESGEMTTVHGNGEQKL